MQRKQNAQKRKKEKEITFRTKPARSPGYRENFEEGENRAHALVVTVMILVVMMLAVAAFAMFYFMRKRSQAGGTDYSSSIKIISDSSVQETTAPQTQSEAAVAEETQVQSETQAQSETQVQSETQAQSETQMQSETQSQS